MRNTIRSQQTVSEEELKKVTDMDWSSYYRESVPTEQQGLSTCPECNSIVIARDGQEDVTCYKCGHVIKLD
jgi:hypothetical protein